jgi:hypothetical protein
MRALVLAGAAAIGIGLLGTSGVSAAPANGIAIDRSAAVIDQATPQEVGWHGRWRSHWRWGSRGWGWGGGHWRWGSRHWR